MYTKKLCIYYYNVYPNIHLRIKTVTFKRVEGLAREGEDDIFKWL